MLDPNDKEAPVEELEDVVVPEGDADPAAPKTVDLDEEDETQRLASLDVQERNKAFAAMRKEAAEAKRERAELQKRITEYENKPLVQAAARVELPQTNQQREFIGGVPVPQNKAEWDALARQDWQTAVDMRSIISARRVQEESKRVETSTRSMEESKQKALARHPELADANSEKGKIFLEVLAKNPDYFTMSKGPILAMRDMEDEMEARGYTREQIFESKKVAAQNEVTRSNRAALTGGGRMPAPQGRTVQLSKDDLEFCKSQGLDPKDYAKEKLAMNKKEA